MINLIFLLFAMTLAPNDRLKSILDGAKTIALTIHSPKPERPSYQIAQYLRSVGYQVYPIHPAVEAIDGQPVYASLADLPGPVDIVNVFRRAEALPGVVQAVIDGRASLSSALGQAPVIWAQLGVVHGEADALATEAGLVLVSDRCIMVEHQRLLDGRSR